MAKIISIGNITMGGTGKTPMVIKLGAYYIEKGFRVAVLSRGYKGRIGYDYNVISDGEQVKLCPPLAADEPYLIASKLKKAYVVTCKDRGFAIKHIIRDVNPDIILLDDAYQRKDIDKDVDILLLDYENPISTGLPFPFGYLRELPNGIKRADIVVFTKCKGRRGVPNRVSCYVVGKPIYFSDVVFCGIYHGDELVNYSSLSFVAFSGLANNLQFYDFLIKNGVNIAAFRGFSDHHIYSVKDYEKLQIVQNRFNADFFLTTEKDYVKLPCEMRKKSMYVKIETKIDGEDNFFSTIESFMKSNST
ncbi:MAG: tetraacyldisaccharide 4'-kinase [Calditerrivibrio sp.]|nr:tetraacyldisaccharide 4'-kinase [Calditerrivibrio sp.]